MTAKHPSISVTGRGDILLRIGRLLGDESGDRTRPVILAVVLVLAALGLIEVASASSVESVAAGRDPYDLPLKQGMWTAAGIAIMFGLARLRTRHVRWLAWPLLGAAVVALGLVFTPLGMTVNGNRNWLGFGGFTVQPSEFAKLALILWAAAVLSRKQALLHEWKHAVVPLLLPAGALIIGLVALGHDLGTAMIIMMILAATMFYGGVRMKVFGVAGIVCTVGSLILAATSGNRVSRISSWLGAGSADDSQGVGYQALHGQYALASGGWLGVGLGQSRQKWNWIPEAHNDFIFTILGEELGLAGTLLVLVLFTVLGIAVFKVIARTQDTFARIVSSSVITWIIGQAVVNIAMVTGLLPVIGVPLPFISYGGSAMVSSMAGVGMILAVTRPQPVRTVRAKRQRAAVHSG
ncbi:cell division protein FtsW [Arthrobacter globiformis NBRC 12137]|uniref:Probable peptidoglycan glycosyltransferase FtsW n=1 Tax=Arthrobacter globiformis (strain ATCC 8010 / DSM 20124 / JCM 1332 / NBRC 12137 / NCIMB 8907 / NRRL B-2979 / 168) TaxID=1077972 RepID=H0QTV0_ARTG1|nr:putative lipid II flippase FtsW [Arthrobacter globiformis]GAB16251.1 cell division protein FtsW [Arthrobacter globiformis NBRC 12137]